MFLMVTLSSHLFLFFMCVHLYMGIWYMWRPEVEMSYLNSAQLSPQVVFQVIRMEYFKHSDFGVWLWNRGTGSSEYMVFIPLPIPLIVMGGPGCSAGTVHAELWLTSNSFAVEKSSSGEDTYINRTVCIFFSIQGIFFYPISSGWGLSSCINSEWRNAFLLNQTPLSLWKEKWKGLQDTIMRWRCRIFNLDEI